jgi:hypothetical protein
VAVLAEFAVQQQDERQASEELLRRADESIVKMQRELARLKRAADLYRERREGPKHDHQ